MRRGWWIAVAAAGALLAFLALRRDDEGATPARRDEAAARPHPTTAAAPATRARPSFAQPGVAGRRVAGAVTYEGGPVEGALVTLETQPTRFGAAPPARALTDGGGRFDLGPQPAEAAELVASHPGQRSAVLRLDLRDPTLAPPPDQVQLALGRCEATLDGVVEDNSGGAIARASVIIERARLTTDEAGAFTACVAPGGVEIAAAAPGYARGTITTWAPRRQRVRIGLAPEAILRGRTVRAEDQTPLDDVIVGVISDLAMAETVSGPEGRFTVDGLPSGPYRLRASGDGYRYRRRREDRVTLAAGVDGGELVLALERMARVRGRVVAAGRPLPGAQVELVPVDYTWREFPELGRAVTQADGTFAIDDLPPGAAVLRVEGWRLVGSELREIAPDAPEMLVEVTAMARIRGTVLRDGKPVAGAAVQALDPSRRGRASAVSRADGSYDLVGLPPGEHGVTAESAELGAFAAPRAITLGEDELREGVDLVLDLSGSIAGVVVDAGGRPVEGLQLVFSLVGGRDFGRAVSALDGSFRAGGLSGGGDYQVSIRRGQQVTELAPAAGGAFPAVRVADGKSHVEGVRFGVRDDRLAITGRVRRQGGAPVPDVRVDAVEQSDRGGEVYRSETGSALSRADGGFEIEDLPTGRYVLRTRPGDGAPLLVRDVEAGARDVLVEVPAGGGIEGTLVGFAAPPAVIVTSRDGMLRMPARVTGDRFSVAELPPGSYGVAASSDAEGDVAVVEVVGNAAARATLTSRGSAQVDGRASDFRSGAPVPGMLCNWWQGAAGDRGEPFAAGGRTAATSDRDGRFTLRVPAGRPIRVACLARRWGREAATAVTVDLAAGGRGAARIPVVIARRPEEARGWLDADLSRDPPATVLTLRPALAAAGLAVGDVILAVDGLAVTELDGPAVSVLISDRAAGESAALTVRRGGATLELRAPIDPRGSR